MTSRSIALTPDTLSSTYHHFSLYTIQTFFMTLQWQTANYHVSSYKSNDHFQCQSVTFTDAFCDAVSN